MLGRQSAVPDPHKRETEALGGGLHLSALHAPVTPAAGILLSFHCFLMLPLSLSLSRLTCASDNNKEKSWEKGLRNGKKKKQSDVTVEQISMSSRRFFVS